MPRLLFQKTGSAIWISHLDLMRLFQRGFKRAGLCLKHTQGFNPRPSVSIALPLSVGAESCCELLDFELDGQAVPCEEIMDRLNRTLISGVRVLSVYENGRKLKELSLLRCVVTMEYDNGIPSGAEEAIRGLFSGTSLIVTKKGKNGVTEQDIIPMLRSFVLRVPDGNILELEAVVCCQNPTLNPTQLTAAITRYLPQYQPDFAKCSRVELYDMSGEIFR